MKSIFNDLQDWKYFVTGDWRDEKGKVIVPKKHEGKTVVFGGGLGFYYFAHGKFNKAIKVWEESIRVIRKIEKEENIRFHKGWYFFQIYLCYRNLESIEADKWLKLAQEEDRISYGKKFNKFSAFKVNK